MSHKLVYGGGKQHFSQGVSLGFMVFKRVDYHAAKLRLYDFLCYPFLPAKP
jgi:hypothetical protein